MSNRLWWYSIVLVLWPVMVSGYIARWCWFGAELGWTKAVEHIWEVTGRIVGKDDA